jgi:hypothetical protein
LPGRPARARAASHEDTSPGPPPAALPQSENNSAAADPPRSHHKLSPHPSISTPRPTPKGMSNAAISWTSPSASRPTAPSAQPAPVRDRPR